MDEKLVEDEFDRIADELQKQAWEGFSATLIDHAMNPRNVGSLPNADGYASYLGPCGDNMQIWIRVKSGKVEDVTFWTDGCGTTIACGSMVTELAKGSRLGEAMAITAHDIASALGGLPQESVHCAGLAATALKMALLDYLNSVRDPWKKAYRPEGGKVSQS